MFCDFPVGDLAISHYNPEVSNDRWVQSALTVQGKRSNLARSTWLALGQAIGLTPRSTERALATQAGATNEALALVERSALPAAQKEAQAAWLRQRTSVLEA